MSSLGSSAAQYFRLHLLPCKCIHLQTGQYSQTPKYLAPLCFDPLGNGWRTPHSGLLKTFGGGKNPVSTGKSPLPIPVSITEEALKGFSNDFLSINWIFKSQCSYSNSPGSKTFQQKGTHHRHITAKAEEK